MLIHCHYCEARVDAECIGSVVEGGSPDDPQSHRVNLLKCPSCKNGLVGSQYDYQTHDGWEWDDVKRVWPQPDRSVNWRLPQVVKVSLEEASTCFRAAAYSACAVMCGRALEGVCIDKKTKKQTLAHGLKELLETKVIDERLFAWGDELRKARNLGAHASDEKVPMEDARDLLDFLHAICDYVYILTTKYDDFLARQAKRESARSAAQLPEAGTEEVAT